MPCSLDLRVTRRAACESTCELRPRISSAVETHGARRARWGTAGRLGALLFAAVCAAALGNACRTAPAVPPEPPPIAAEAEFARARALQRAGDSTSSRAARQAAERAAALAPEWVAPQRLLDDLLRDDLLGLEALRHRRAALREGAGDAAAYYLVGRLEGAEGEEHFLRAAALDPTLAWGHHGLAWVAEASGDREAALAHEARAVQFARGPWERVFFGSAQARLLAGAGQVEAAAATLGALLGESLPEADRTLLRTQLASVLMRPGGERGDFASGYELGLELLYTAELTDGELIGLVDRMTFPTLVRSGDEQRGELLLALGAQASPTRARLAAELRLQRGPSALSLALLDGANGDGSAAVTYVDPVARRRVRFALGDYGAGVGEWLDSLPRFLLDGDGLPRDARLADLVRSAAGRTRSNSTTTELEILAVSLVDAGWFVEAREVVDALAPSSPEDALVLERRAEAGAVLVRGLVRIAGTADVAEARRRAEEPVSDLDDLLTRTDLLWRRYGDALGVGELGPPLIVSPRFSYGPFGSLVHPGPRFAERDERAGRGAAGEPVPGLAHVLDTLGRFGTFGEMLGMSGPDATILQRVVVEEAAGEHLGVPWQGTVVWCEAPDLVSRAGRLGARISGAAVHEGYWIDLDGPRSELAGWRELERRFYGPDAAPGRVERALATEGLELGSINESVRRPERTRVLAALGEASRVRLAVLRDRRLAGLAPPDLDELARVTATHEEGHLCDRTRFLPLRKRPFALFGLLVRAGFDSEAVQQRLEYRAQLVAIVGSPEPRLALAEVLDSAGGGGEEVTPHGGAYRGLLRELLRALDRAVEAEPTAWPAIDPNRYLVHQFHRLTGEEVRQLAWNVARREGMVENGAQLPRPSPPRAPVDAGPALEVQERDEPAELEGLGSRAPGSERTGVVTGTH